MLANISPAQENTVRHTAFGQGVQAFRRTLSTTPLGWGLIVWVCGGVVGHRGLTIWLGLCGLVWLSSVLLLRSIHHAGPTPERHGRLLLCIAALDGTCWGLMVPLVMGNDAILNAWLTAILCGVAAVNAPVFITWVRAYQAQMAALWLMVALSAWLYPARPQGLVGFVGLSLFLLLISDYMHRISKRAMEGIRLQIANADLAEQLRLALVSSQQQAVTDLLTGLPNRRGLDDWLRPQRRLPLALLMLDLDHFKAVNDVHGHATGDAVLRAFAQRVQAQLRPGDFCARWGGEEFVVVLPSTSLPLALEVADRLRLAVAATPLVDSLSITVSAGAAALREGEAADSLLARADAAVYLAKHQGRNRVCSEPPRAELGQDDEVSAAPR